MLGRIEMEVEIGAMALYILPMHTKDNGLAEHQRGLEGDLVEYAVSPVRRS